MPTRLPRDQNPGVVRSQGLPTFTTVTATIPLTIRWPHCDDFLAEMANNRKPTAHRSLLGVGNAANGLGLI